MKWCSDVHVENRHYRWNTLIRDFESLTSHQIKWRFNWDSFYALLWISQWELKECWEVAETWIYVCIHLYELNSFCLPGFYFYFVLYIYIWKIGNEMDYQKLTAEFGYSLSLYPIADRFSELQPWLPFLNMATESFRDSYGGKGQLGHRV